MSLDTSPAAHAARAARFNDQCERERAIRMGVPIPLPITGAPAVAVAVARHSPQEDAYRRRVLDLAAQFMREQSLAPAPAAPPSRSGAPTVAVDADEVTDERDQAPTAEEDALVTQRILRAAYGG